MVGAYAAEPVSSLLPTTISSSTDTRQIIARLKAHADINEGLATTKRSQSSAQPTLVPGLKVIREMSFKKNLPAARSAISGAEQGFDIAVFQITDNNLAMEQAISQLQANGQIEYAEPDYPLSIDANTPNDTDFLELYGLNNTGQSGGSSDADIDAPEAWDITTGDPGIVVAVIDTGIQYDHPDLEANMWTNPGEIPDNNIDDDVNGYTDDIHGINLVNIDADPMDDNGHGTHVAGTIGAVGNNSIGVTGVNWDVRLMALKYLDANGDGYTSNAIEALNYVYQMKVNHGVNVRLTNNSWGGGGYSQLLYDTIALTEAEGILFIASAGNDGLDNDTLPHYPSSYDLDSIITVAGTDHNDNAYSSTNYGLTSVDLGAPSVSIYSTLPGGGYGMNTGTSMATPHVSGAAALLWANKPGLSISQVKGLLLNSADPINAMNGITLTGGRLNVYNALTCGTGNLKMYVTAPMENSLAVVGNASLFKLGVSDCGDPISGATITATPDNGDPLFSLLDDGIAPDDVAGDSIYTSNWVPATAGPVNIAIQASYPGSSDLNDTRSLTVMDIPTYTADDTYPYAWSDISDAANLGLGQEDDSDAEVTIGFDFDFYGSSYDTVWAHTNGMLTFGSRNELPYFDFLTIPDMIAPNNFIATFWEDLNPIVSDGDIFYEPQGIAPNRRLVIQWHDLKHFKQIEIDGPQSSVTFQAILYEGSNDIVVQYLDTVFDDPLFDHGERALTGIEFLDGSLGLEYANQEGGLNNGMALLYTPGSDKKVLTVDESMVGGSVEDNQIPHQQINCPTNCYGQYADTTTVILSAVADPGFTFSGWNGAGCSGTGNCVISMDQHRHVQAVFVVTPMILINPSGGLTTTEGGGSASFDIQLTTQPSHDVTVAMSSDDLSEGVVSPSLVTFTPLDWDQPHVVTVIGQNDEIDDGDIDYRIITDTAISDDMDYDGLDPLDVTFSNTNDDTAGISVTPLSGLVTTESKGQASFSVVLDSLPLSDVTLALSSSDSTEGGIDKTLLTFTPLDGKTGQIVTITGIDDKIIDGSIAYKIVTHASDSLDNLYDNINLSDISVTNTDNDTAIVHITPQTGLITTEATGDEEPVFNVRLETFPTHDVTINLSSSRPGEASLSPASLLFKTDDATTSQIVTVTGVNDDFEDGDVNFQITTANAVSEDKHYSGLAIPDVYGTNLDDEDDDDDNDGIDNFSDIDPENPNRCIDMDADSCDDCSIGVDGHGPESDADVLNDGPDNDLDGLCDAGDTDDDNDTILDAAPDNCQFIANLDQADANNNGIGDVCEAAPEEQPLCLPIKNRNNGLAVICL